MTVPPLLARARELQTRERPVGERFGLFGSSCFICGGGTLDTETWQRRVTYSRERGEQGLYDIQTHKEWCPVLAEGDPGPGCCPECGTRVMEIQYENGFRVTVDTGAGQVPVVGSYDEVMDQLAPYPLEARGRLERCIERDRLEVSPCGHVVEGERGLALRRELRQLWLEESA